MEQVLNFLNSPLFAILLGFGLALLVLLAALSHVSTAPVRDPIKMLRRTMKAEGIPYPWFFFFATLWLAIFLTLLFGLIAELVLLFLPTTHSGTDAVSELRFHLTKITALTAVLGAVVAFPFTVIRIRLTQEQNSHAKEVLLNDKLNAAISDLHARRQETDRTGDTPCDVWEDDIVRRSGAIDRLEALAREQPTFAQRIADMLSVYLKELTREYPAQTPPEGATPDELKKWANELKPARSDMEKAAQVMGRLATLPPWTPETLIRDLSKVNLQGFRLAELEFSEANLSGAEMQGANLTGAKMQGANLPRAKMQGADLSWAKMQGADLSWAKMQGADLSVAEMQGANLTWAQMDEYTNLDLADTSRAAVYDMDLSTVTLSDDQLTDMFGDASVILPDWMERPRHWPDRDLVDSDFFEEWRLYKSNPAAYIPPQDRDD